MSEQVPNQDIPQQQKDILALGITLSANGIPTLVGTASHDKTIAYGLLEVMRDMIYEYDKKMRFEEQSKLVKANGHNMMNFLRKK